MGVDELAMSRAVYLAQQSKRLGGLPFGAVITRGEDIVAASMDTLLIESDVTAHAEMRALSHACRRLDTVNLSECTIYTTMEPCVMCMSAILAALIPRVVVAGDRDDVPHFFKHRKIRMGDLVDDADQEVEIVRGVLRDEAVELFSDVHRVVRFPGD